MLHRKRVEFLPQVPTTDSGVCLLGSVAFGQEPQVKDMYGRPFRDQTPLLSEALDKQGECPSDSPTSEGKRSKDNLVMPETFQGSRRFPQGHLSSGTQDNPWASHLLILFPLTTKLAAILRVQF